MEQLQRKGRLGSLALVVGCTNSKSLPVPPGLRVTDLEGGSERPAHWWRHVAEAEVRVPLRALYGGAQWAASLDLETRAERLGHEVDLWVMSAGLGLTAAHTTAPAYAASFSPGPDAVAMTAAERQTWWLALRDRTHSFQDLAERYDQLVVVLAPTYLEVVRGDLSRLRTQALAVVSSCRLDLVYSSNGLRRALRASAMTLNAAAAGQLLTLAGEQPIGSDDVRAQWEQWATENTRHEAIARRVAADHEVTAYIESSLAEAHASRTMLLTRFRADGRACEQSRFKRLYEDVLRSGT